MAKNPSNSCVTLCNKIDVYFGKMWEFLHKVTHVLNSMNVLNSMKILGAKES